MKKIEEQHKQTFINVIQGICGIPPSTSPLLINVKGEDIYYVMVDNELYYWKPSR